MNQLLPDSSLLLAAAPGVDVASSLDDTIKHAAFTGETCNKNWLDTAGHQLLRECELNPQLKGTFIF
jgi:hypothetical protein